MSPLSDILDKGVFLMQKLSEKKVREKLPFIEKMSRFLRN